MISRFHVARTHGIVKVRRISLIACQVNKEQALKLSIIGVLTGALAETSEHIK